MSKTETYTWKLLGLLKERRAGFTILQGQLLFLLLSCCHLRRIVVLDDTLFVS